MTEPSGRVEVIDRGESPTIIDLDFHATRPVPVKNTQSDAFGRLEVASPITLFDSKFIDSKRSIFWDEVISGAGASSTLGNSTITLAVTNDEEYVIRQTYQKFNYQPGKLQQVILTAIMSTEVGVTKRYGYFNTGPDAPYTSNIDGIWFENDGTGYCVCVAKNGTINKIPQTSWNYDKLDGTGVSGFTLDPSKNQLMFLEFEWLGTGSVWFGFFIGGTKVLVHRVDHSNVSDNGVYMVSPNQPVRAEIRSSGGSGSMLQICTSVVSYGAKSDNGIMRSVSTNSTPVQLTSVGTKYACLGIRLKDANRFVTVRPESISINTEVSTPGDLCLVEVILNPTVSGVFTYNSLTESAVEYALGTTSNTASGGYTLKSWYTDSDNPITLIREVIRYIGESVNHTKDSLVICLTPVFGANQDAFVGFNWRELA